MDFYFHFPILAGGLGGASFTNKGGFPQKGRSSPMGGPPMGGPMGGANMTRPNMSPQHKPYQPPGPMGNIII